MSSAEGVTVAIAHDGLNPTFVVSRGSTVWTRDGFKSSPTYGNNRVWRGTTTKLNADATQRFRVITDIAHPSDMDYIAFGYWSLHPSASQDLDNGFEPYYRGSMPYIGNVKNLSGQATYRGNAIGAYSILGTSIRGDFEGEVSLTASFGSSGQVEGRMTRIVDIKTLYLEYHDPLSGFGNPAPFSASYGSSGRSFANTSCGTADCDWGGEFLGPSGNGAVPTGAVGWFENLTVHKDSDSGERRTARLDGAFGAQRQ